MNFARPRTLDALGNANAEERAYGLLALLAGRQTGSVCEFRQRMCDQ